MPSQAAARAFSFPVFHVAGTYLFNQFLLNVSQMEVNSMVLQAGEVRPAPSSGWAAYLLLLNPAATFAELLESEVEEMMNRWRKSND